MQSNNHINFVRTMCYFDLTSKVFKRNFNQQFSFNIQAANTSPGFQIHHNECYLPFALFGIVAVHNSYTQLSRERSWSNKVGDGFMDTISFSIVLLFKRTNLYRGT